ncbi:hypothetical protein F5141DRAFT_1068706 [Pisolithus sp. B1]|nr:hypothetical protein F5141DRAFT_1068706 [Pisolithus sp. B1]
MSSGSIGKKMEEKPIEVVTEDSLGLRHAVRLEREKVIHTFSDEKSALHGVPTVRCGQSTTANRSESRPNPCTVEVTWNVFVKRLWVTMGKVYEAVRVEMYKAGTLPWTSTVSLHHIAFISGYRLWGRTKPSTQTVGDRAMVKLLARGNRVDNGETSGCAVPSDLCMGIRVQVGSAWQGIVSTANGGHPVYQFSSDDWGEGVFEYECSPCRMLVQMKTIEIDHFSDFFGVANDLLGNQTTPLSTTSIPRIWTQGKIRFAMRCTMPRYRQRRNVVGFEREKMGRKPIEVVTEDSLGLCHAVWFEREKVIHTFGGEKYALLRVLTVHCGRSTTAIGVNCTKSTVVETSTSHQSQDGVLLLLLAPAAFSEKASGIQDVSVISFGVVKLRSTMGFSSLCLPLPKSSGLPHLNPIAVHNPFSEALNYT